MNGYWPERQNSVSERRTWRFGLAGLALLSVLLRLRFVFTPITSDEGGYLAVARAWRHGKLLYTQVWVDRPQGTLLLYRLWDILSFGDEDHLRVISLVFGAAAVVGLAVIVGALSGRRSAGVIAGVLGALLSSAPALEGYSANGELLGGTFSVVCLAVAVRVLVGRSDRRWMFAAGALGAIGFSMKQAGIDGLLALGLWLLVVWATGARPRPEVLALLWRTVVGAAGVLALLVLHALTLNMSDWWYAMFGYRLDSRSALKGANFDRFWSTWSDAKPLFVPMMLAAFVCAVVVVVGRRSSRFAIEKSLLPLWLICAFATFFSGGQFFHHYWITLTFPVAALCALVIGAAPWELKWVSVMVASVFAMVSWGSLALESRSEIPVSISGETRPLKAEHVGHWLREQMESGDTMYAMCAAAHSYAHAHVDPPYPYLWFDGVRQARHAQQLLIALFQQHPPTWVAGFDSAAACNGTGEVAAVLAASYRQVATVDGVPIYRLQPSGR
ncbi:unannotated protein [freshwater metagenome]|uniref:Unannotated protein n=1 Tax=freshwater metagenome TaxID=449393 RepID=A0A6J7BTG9_9ZZZZ